MTYFYYILITILGLSVGSFLNVVILRFDDLKTIIRVRSHCPKCQKELPWYDLVPLFSYLLLAGKCRWCKKAISLQYPLVEATTALLFILIYCKFGLSIQSLFLALIGSLSIVIAAYDILHYEVPDILTYLAIALAAGLALYFIGSSGQLRAAEAWLPYAYGLIIGLGFLGFLVVASRQQWMGAGDILLGAFMGIFLGFPKIILALFLAFIIGSIVSIILLGLKKKTLKDAVPFGPFLLAATWISVFWGDSLINLYWAKMGL